MVGFKQRLAERIVEAREEQGWDQRELAFRAQISDKTIQRLEGAQVDKPRPSTLRKIAEATGRTVADIRPDMESEEKDLRAQLDRIEEKVDDALNRLQALSVSLAVEAGAEGESKRRGSGRTLRTKGKRSAGR